MAEAQDISRTESIDSSCEPEKQTSATNSSTDVKDLQSMREKILADATTNNEESQAESWLNDLNVNKRPTHEDLFVDACKHNEPLVTSQNYDSDNESHDSFTEALDELTQHTQSVNLSSDKSSVIENPSGVNNGHLVNGKDSHEKHESSADQGEEKKGDGVDWYKEAMGGEEEEETLKGKENSDEPEEDPDAVTDERLRAEELLLTDTEKQERMKKCKELKERGNEEYKQTNYSEAVDLYSDAITACLVAESRDRAVLYANRSAAKMCLDKMEDALTDCTRAVDLDSEYLKARLRRAEIYERLDKLEEALKDYQTILERDPSIHKARAACMRLPSQIQEKNEKLKAEMIDKLKELGNMVLRPFGLSTNNFKLNQDPNTGGYNISFQQ